MKGSIKGAGGEFRPSPKDGTSLKSDVKFEGGDGGVKSVKNPLSGSEGYRPGNKDDQPGKTRWDLGEGKVNVIKKPGA